MFLSRIRASAAEDADRTPWGNWWFQELGPRSMSGVNVTGDTALGHPSVYACVRVLSESFACMPFTMYRQRRTDKGRGEKDRTHWLYRLFAKKPNSFQSPFEWRLMLQGHLALRGNAYCQITANSRGEITSLLPLHPARMSVRMLDNGDWRYEYQSPNGRIVTYPRGEIWHLRGMSGDGIMGYSPIRLAAEAIGQGLSVQAYSSRFFANDARPGGWIEYPGHFSTAEKKKAFRDSWQEMQGGSNRGKVALLERGMKFHEVGLSNEDSQLVDVLRENGVSIASVYRVPPHKIGRLERCMPADTLVMTAAGPKRIVDVCIGDEVWSPTEEGPRLHRVTNWWNNGTRDVLEIRTTNRTVRCTPNHRLLVRRKVYSDMPIGQRGGANIGGKKKCVAWENQYVEAGDLLPGDTLVSLDGLPQAGNTIAPNGRVLTVGFMEFAGLLAGDGNVFDWGASIARADGAGYMDHYRRVMTVEFTKGGRVSTHGAGHPMAKLSDEDVAKIRAAKPLVCTAASLAREYGANVGTVAAIGRGREYHADHPQASISAESLAQIRARLAARITTDELAIRFGVGRNTINNVLNGNAWAGAVVAPIEPITLREGCRKTSFSSVSAAEELRSLGLSGTAFTKRVPGWVFGLEEDLRLAFLRGIVDSDGSIDKMGRIHIALVNKALIEDLRHLCMSCGVPVTNIVQSTATTMPPEASSPVTTTMFRFVCGDPGANRRIGTNDPRYFSRLDGGKPFDRKDRAYPRHGGEGFSVEGLALSRISSITPIGAMPTFDIEVEGAHCFFADGVASHNSTNNNIEHQSIEFWTDTMLPYAELWESSIESFLLDQDGTDLVEYDTEFDMSRMLRGDTAARTAYYAARTQWSSITPNEVRIAEGDDPIELPGMNTPIRPVNMVPINGGSQIATPAAAQPGSDSEGEDDPAPPPPQRDSESASRLRGMVTATAARLARRAAEDLKRRPAEQVFDAKFAGIVAESLCVRGERAQALCAKFRADPAARPDVIERGLIACGMGA